MWHMWRSGQLLAGFLLPLCGFRKLNSGQQARQRVSYLLTHSTSPSDVFIMKEISFAILVTTVMKLHHLLRSLSYSRVESLGDHNPTRPPVIQTCVPHARCTHPTSRSSSTISLSPKSHHLNQLNEVWLRTLGKIHKVQFFVFETGSL